MENYKPLDTNYWDIENSFYLNSSNDRIGKFLSHYEIYKDIVNLPGDILELGVFKGASMVRWCTFRNLLECQGARKIYGFDAFSSFPVGQCFGKESLEFAKDHDDSSGLGISKEDLEAILSKKNIGNVKLFKGDVFDTLPGFLEANPYLKLSLLHLDMDIYEPTDFALKLLWDRLVPGGVMVVDDYNAVAGATKAVDDFFADVNFSRSFKAKYYHVPTIFVK